MTASDNIYEASLAYHEHPVPGKIAIALTKPTETQYDLALAYSPGVAEPVRRIFQDPTAAYRYTAKGNLIGIITNGTAVLGLGNMGALASKPVMEGKAALFKRFAGIDVFDIEMDCDEPGAMIESIVHIAPTFGGVNLEDIKAPECFIIEQALRERLNIPVFHDDQHGTAVVIVAGILNALELQGKSLQEASIVCVGAGAAGIASAQLLITLGADRARLILVDRQGVIHDEREDLNRYKREFAVHTKHRTLEDALKGADIFIGLSGPALLTPVMLKTMADRPIIFALSNPEPEIMPALAYQARNDLIMATGRSDYPNQVNNALCFPYIFRAALDVRATCINQPMLIAAATAIRDLARAPIPADLLKTYPDADQCHFSSTYILPKIIDPRLREWVSSAVAKAAVETGVATQV